jgi:hypothetical protein
MIFYGDVLRDKPWLWDNPLFLTGYLGNLRKLSLFNGGRATRIGGRAAFLSIQVCGGSRFFKLELREGQVFLTHFL